jgi:parallel beta-helix repeat protein
MTLLFRKGVIRNGTLIGSMTKIACTGKAFDKVTIKGSWDVPEISTELFADLSYENSLRDVAALAHPEVENRIVIEKGEYKVRAAKGSATCISVCGNTDLILNGTVRLAPNDLKSCNVILAEGKNINITGKGTIIGDKHTHTGTEGEWGMGIRLHKAINATVSGLTIKDCWGDCIYVGGNSRNVLIEDCKLDNGRRQGISVTKASGVTIRNCTITNVSGTSPQYAIDVEPNLKDSIDDVLIERVVVKDCEGGFMVTRRAQKKGAAVPWIGKVTIRDCKISSKSKYPVRVKRCEAMMIDKCILNAHHGISAIKITNVGRAVVNNNTLSVSYGMLDKIKIGLSTLVGKGDEKPVDIRATRKKVVQSNRIQYRSSE